MKTQKIIISSLILASFLTPSLSVLNAQVVNDAPATVGNIESLKQELITLLTQLIAQLQEQILALQTQQSQTASAVASLTPVSTSTQTFGSTQPAYVYTPVLQLGGHSESDRGHVYITLPNDVVEAYLSFDNGFTRQGLVAGTKDLTGFQKCQYQSASERANNAPCMPQVYNWTISARSADTSFSTTTGSFLGSDAWAN